MAESTRRRLFPGLFAVLLLAAAWAAAEAGPAPPGPEVYCARRKALAQKLGGVPVLVFGAAKNQAYAPFRQNNRFYYLTGVAEPDAALLLVPAEKREVLFLDPGDPKMERWDGPRLKPGKEAVRITGIETILPREDLPDRLDRLFVGKPAPSLGLPVFPEEVGTRILDASYPALEKRRQDPLDGGTWREDRIRERLEARYETLTIRDASPAIRGLREIKGPGEVEAMLEAARISCLGMIEAIRATKPGVYEYEIASAMADVCRRKGGQGWAYAPIVGSGPNALVLHYSKNDRQVEAGDLVLMDAGFFWAYYATDITRTFPASGAYTPEQRKAYDDLLAVQQEAIDRVKPGVSLLALNAYVNRRLRALGYGKALFHFLGHFVGMAVHDPGRPDLPLRAGHVITIEPGIYLDDEGFGIRIEDTILVTPDGCRVLSEGIPKDPDEIEALMAD